MDLLKRILHVCVAVVFWFLRFYNFYEQFFIFWKVKNSIKLYTRIYSPEFYSLRVNFNIQLQSLCTSALYQARRNFCFQLRWEEKERNSPFCLKQLKPWDRQNPKQKQRFLRSELKVTQDTNPKRWKTKEGCPIVVHVCYLDVSRWCHREEKPRGAWWSTRREETDLRFQEKGSSCFQDRVPER